MMHQSHPTTRRSARAVLVLAAIVLTACTAQLGMVQPAPVKVLIFGEQHDQPAHQQQAAEAVATLAGNGQLAAVVLEMADAGRDTRALPRDANEATARTALSWSEAGWPWAAYGPVVMNAVRSGIPVLGGNLPRAETPDAQRRSELDAAVPPAAAQALREAIDIGHCGLLPAAALPSMLRIQIARDERMAQTVAAATTQAKPGQTVLLLTGEEHAARDRGVPLHLARLGLQPSQIRVVGWAGGSELPVDERRIAERTPSSDHCAELQRSLQSAPRK